MFVGIYRGINSFQDLFGGAGFRASTALTMADVKVCLESQKWRCLKVKELGQSAGFSLWFHLLYLSHFGYAILITLLSSLWFRHLGFHVFEPQPDVFAGGSVALGCELIPFDPNSCRRFSPQVAARILGC